MRRLLAATLVLLTLFLPFQAQSHTQAQAAKGAAAKTQAARYAIAKGLVNQPDRFFSPTQIFKLTADPFARMVFMEVRLGPDWGPDHPQWAPNYPAFRAEVLELLLPLGASLDDYLASTLAQALLSLELERLRDRFADPGLSRAIQRLDKEGLPWQTIMLSILMQQMPGYYSAAERASVAERLKKGFGRTRQTAELKTLDKDLAPVGEFMDSPQFKQYFGVMGEAFLDRTRQLSKNYPQAVPRLVQQWRARLER